MKPPEAIPLLIDVESGERFEIGPVFTIGRSRSCDLVLDNRRVSRQHAMIRRDGESYLFFDLDSSNGSWVNGQQVKHPVTLADGSQIRIGPRGFGFHSSERRRPPQIEPTLPPDATMVLIDRRPTLLLVADIHAFTTLSEDMGEHGVADMLRPWYERCREIIGTAGGTIDKFIGDSVFAYWSEISDDSRAAACESAEALACSLSGLEGLDGGLCGVALHIGNVAIGAMSRGEHTALGEAVNLTFRVEGLTRPMGRLVLATDAFVDGWAGGEGRFDPCGIQSVRGFKRPVEVFALQGF